MKVIRANSAGFCWGVKRAIDIARDYASKGKHPIFTDGPLIHNNQMMEKLEKEGIKEVGDYQSKGDLNIDEDEKNGAVMVVRAHGVSPDRRKYLKSLGLEFRDATCPDVGVIAGKVRTHSRKGYSTVIFGDPNHPEVIGLLGYTSGNGYAIKDQEDIDKLPPMGDKVCMVSQSTMFTDEFHKLSDYLKSKYPDLLTFDTICNATKERQSGIKSLMDEGAEAVIVIGGHHSANTRKLTALVERQNIPAYHIETASELDIEHLQCYKVIGVTAGASTPNFIIDQVCSTLESYDSKG